MQFTVWDHHNMIRYCKFHIEQKICAANRTDIECIQIQKQSCFSTELGLKSDIGLLANNCNHSRLVVFFHIVWELISVTKVMSSNVLPSFLTTTLRNCFHHTVIILSEGSKNKAGAERMLRRRMFSTTFILAWHIKCKV